MESLERDPLILIHDLARMMRTRFDQHARRYGMTRAQWIILLRLERQPGLSQNELAAICEVEPITVGRLIDRLEKHELVERRSDPDDRRIRRLHLLPASQPILTEIGLYLDAARKQITGGMPGGMLEHLADALMHIKNNLNADPPYDDKVVAAGE
jgi:MarR family transcriptional regulator for hemolysin